MKDNEFEEENYEIDENELIEFIKPYREIAISSIAEHFFPAPLPYRNYFLSRGRAGNHSELFYKTAQIVERAEKTIKNVLNNIIERKVIHGSINPLPHKLGLFFVNEAKEIEEKKQKRRNGKEIMEERKLYLELKKEEQELKNREIQKAKDRKNLEELEKFEEKFKELQKRINDLNFIDSFIHKKSIYSIEQTSEFFRKRREIPNELLSLYRANKNNETIKNRTKTIFIEYFTPHFEINPFEVDEQLISYFKGSLGGEIILLNSYFSSLATDDPEFESFKKELESINYDIMKNQYLLKQIEEVKEYIFDLPIDNLFNFLLDFSNVLPLGVGTGGVTEDSTEIHYTIKTYFGLLTFRIVEKEINRKIIYEYDFSKSDVKEKGKLLLEFSDLTSGKVKLSVKNEIFESSPTNEMYVNWLGKHLKAWIDHNIGKVVAKVIQTVFYEKNFDDLTMGNHRLLQAKLNAMGRDINSLKNRFFEVKAPLTLTSFECSECGATLNITSKEEKFIICEHCNTPFLMEWQKEK